MVMSDFRRSKLLFVFKTFFDVDNSGSIDQEDFKLSAERVCRSRGWSTDEGKGAAVKQHLLAVWDSLKSIDANSDGTVDEEEWVSMWEGFGAGSQQWQEKYRDFIFNATDTSGEGTIEEEEFTLVNTKYGASASDCAEAFKRMTKNNSISITKDVFTDLWKEFFASDDPEAPGNFIFGRLAFN